MKRAMIIIATIPTLLLALGSFWMAPTRWDGNPDMSAGFQRLIGQTARWIHDNGGASIHDPIVQTVLARMREIGRSADQAVASSAEPRLARRTPDGSLSQQGSAVALNYDGYADNGVSSGARTGAGAAREGGAEPSWESYDRPTLGLDGRPRADKPSH